jgi:hypothetical protein
MYSNRWSSVKLIVHIVFFFVRSVPAVAIRIVAIFIARTDLIFGIIIGGVVFG